MGGDSEEFPAKGAKSPAKWVIFAGVFCEGAPLIQNDQIGD
jgi:hypothetical protein